MPDLTLHIESSRGSHTVRCPVDERGPRLTELLDRAHLPLNTRCGRQGLCDGCLVDLLAGTLIHLPSGRRVAADGQPLSVRGCEYRLDPAGGQARLRVPARSLLAHEPQVVVDFRINVPWANDPLLPTDGVSGGPALGAAIDIGTTTVAVLVVELATGKVLGQAAAFNRQMHLGDDVLTRINLCGTDPGMLGQLQHAVADQTIAPLLHRALHAAGASPAQVAGLVIAGNTTMLHLLAGVDPTPMGVAPFTPRFLEHRVLPASQLGGKLLAGVGGGAEAGRPDRDPPVHLLPGIAAYVGADLVAGILASGLAYDPGPSLLVDVGTNGEIILKHQERMFGCATAAGPAFEGSRLSHGMRAGHGAISHVTLTAEPWRVAVETIGQEPAIGLCGSAYVDFLAEGRRVGLLNSAGRFAADAPAGAAAHLGGDDHARSFRVALGRGKRPIGVSETDIASLLQAKAAIAAGILTLLEQVGITPAQVRTLYLAGGFGMHMNHAAAIGCGLLPGFRPEQVQVVGNTSLAGAYLALLDRSVLPELSRMARQCQIVELNLAPGFEDRYIDQLMLD